MTMNMIIVMVMNIYINRRNTERLENEPNKSGLINKLLDEYYKKNNRLPDGNQGVTPNYLRTSNPDVILGNKEVTEEDVDWGA